MKMIYKSLILLIILQTFSGYVKSQEKNVLIDRIKSQLFFYSTQNVIQNIVVRTDKSLYRPDEKIWLNVFVTDALTHMPSAKSKEVVVQLKDLNGKVLIKENLPLNSGLASSSLTIPSGTKSDRYFLTALTPEMAEGSMNQARDIYICSPENMNLVPEITYSSSVFHPQETGKALLSLSDFSGKPVSGKKFEYRITSATKELLSGKEKTLADGTAELRIPSSISGSGEAMLLNVNLPAGKEEINLVSHIPFSGEKINVSFFPEGGKIVPGIPQKIVYSAKDQLGNPVDVSGNIIDGAGKVITATKIIQKGMGLINMISPENSGYLFKITSEQGEGQVYPLPSPDTTGMSISVLKTDGDLMYLLLARSPNSKQSRFSMITLSDGQICWASEFDLEQSGIIKIPLADFDSEIGDVAIFNSNGTLAGERLIYTGKKKAVNVAVVPDKSVYSTEQEGIININLKRSDGTPVKGLLSVSFSDKSALFGSDDVNNLFNYGLDTPLQSDTPLDSMDKTILDYNLIAKKLHGLDWTKILSIDPDNPKSLKSMGNMNSVTTSRNNESKASYASNTGVNEWKFLEEFQKSGYFRQNSDFLKANLSEKSINNGTKTRQPYWKKYLEHSNNLIDVIRMIKPFDYVNGKLVYRGPNSFLNQDGALIVVDGTRIGTDAEVLNQINPNSVEDIKVSSDPMDITKYTSFNNVGVIEITTKRGPSNNNAENTEVRKEGISGTFSPEPIGNSKYNLLTTLQWIPEMWTNENGEAKISFSTGNIKSDFILNIVGRTEKGEWFEKKAEIYVR